MTHKEQLEAVLQFWFTELEPKDWFTGSKELDAKITERFADTHHSVASGECCETRADARLVLAEILVLDQFSRQIFRGTKAAFAYDAMALTLAQQVVAEKKDHTLSADERLFLYMPFMHSESREIHEVAVKLFESLGKEEPLKYEQIHKDIIDRFGRYPHRNEQLGRTSTDAEREYLVNEKEDFFAS